MENLLLAEEAAGYQTVTDPSNTDKRLLIAGSQNVLIDQQKKVKIRPGYTRLGAANTALTPPKNGWRWDTSTGHKLSQRIYNGVLEAYLGTIDTVAVNAWTKVNPSVTLSTTAMLRPALTLVREGGGWYDSTEGIDLQIIVQGDDNLFEWGGGVAVVESIPDGTHVTKAGTTTWAQNRFYTTRNLVAVCVRTGTEYTYTAGMSGTNLTVADSTGLIVGDILVQKIVTTAQSGITSGYAAGHHNDIPFIFQNQLVVGSTVDAQVWISKNTNYASFAYSTPRVAGEGGIMTLDGFTHAINALGSYLLVFSGQSAIFRADYQQITVSTTLAETLRVVKVDVGVKQGALNHECVVPIGDELAYLTNEVSLRVVSNVQNIAGLEPKTLSNPIKPDFDAELWTGAFGTWYKNVLFFSAPAGNHLWMLNFMQDANGKEIRFWNPPQILPAGPPVTIDLDDNTGPHLYIHSSVVPETYLLFDGLSDGQYANMDVADKLPIHAIAKYAYDGMKKRGVLKTLDEYYVEGEINPNTNNLVLGLNYDFDGTTQMIERTIDGTDSDILEGSVTNNSLAQSLLADQPLGGLLTPPADARRFRVVFEIAREDFFELSAQFESNDVDRYWAVIAHGSNATLSPRKATTIRK